MPTLLSMIDGNGRLVAVTGFRRAAEESLFLERYLSVPIELALSCRARVSARRAEIVEVGNFAAIDARHARILMSFLPAYFIDRSASWIVFTATARIRGILTAIGGRCLEVGVADRACAAGGDDEWGHYYSKDPRVMAGFLPSARSIPDLWRPSHGD